MEISSNYLGVVVLKGFIYYLFILGEQSVYYGACTEVSAQSQESTFSLHHLDP